MDDAHSNLRDAAYTVVGFAVIGFQRAQVRRRELLHQFESLRADLTGQHHPPASPPPAT